MFKKLKQEYKIPDDCQIKGLDEIYKSELGYIKNGTFVEVGAYDGARWSNTSFLADLGWNGIYIEPVKEYYEMCVLRHKKNKNINVLNLAVGEEECDTKIYVGKGLSTISKEHLEFYKKSNFSKHVNFSGSEYCKQKRLENILEDYKIDKFFELLVVDVEGYESEVFNSLNLSYWEPKIMIVELPDENKHFTEFTTYLNKIKKLRKKIHNAGYKEIYMDDINTVFKKFN